MNIETLQQKIPRTRVDGKIPSEEKSRWIQLEELLAYKFYIVYGDSRGDGFVKFAKDEEDFAGMLQKHIVEGRTGCGFDTSVWLIVKNGEPYTPKIS